VNVYPLAIVLPDTDLTMGNISMNGYNEANQVFQSDSNYISKYVTVQQSSSFTTTSAFSLSTSGATPAITAITTTSFSSSSHSTSNSGISTLGYLGIIGGGLITILGIIWVIHYGLTDFLELFTKGEWKRIWNNLKDAYSLLRGKNKKKQNEIKKSETQNQNSEQA